MRDGRDSSLNVIRIPPFLKRQRTELQMPSPTDDPLIPARPTNYTYGCLVGPVQFALGSNKRAGPIIPTATTSFALGTATAANVQCRARRRTLWVQDKCSRSKQTKTHGAVLLEASGQLKGGHTSKPPQLFLASENGELSRRKRRALSLTEPQRSIRSRCVTSRSITRS